MQKIKIISASLAIVIFSVILGFLIANSVRAKYQSSPQKAEAETTLVEKGQLKQYVVSDDAIVVAQESFNLTPNFSGKVEKIFVSDGEIVDLGESLVKLETKELELNQKRLDAVLVQAQSVLNKLRAGATTQELTIIENKIGSMRNGVKNAKEGLIDYIRAAYTASDDAVQGKTNSMFTGIKTGDPQLVYTPITTTVETDIETKRKELEVVLAKWENDVDGLDTSSDLEEATDDARDNIEKVQKYLDVVAYAISLLTPTGDITQDMITNWSSSVSLARLAVDTAKGGLSEGLSELNEVKGGHLLAKDELVLQKTAVRGEDIVAAQAKVDEINAQKQILNNQIEKATLKAPTSGMVMKIYAKEFETIPENLPAVVFATFEQKIQVDIPETKIKDVTAGASASIKIAGIPGMILNGTVNNIEPLMIKKDGDVFYRANVLLKEYNAGIRPGMTADVSIDVNSSVTVLKIPEKYVENIGGREYVTVVKDGKNIEVEVETGIAADNFVEIKDGLNEGDKIVMPSEI